MTFTEILIAAKQLTIADQVRLIIKLLQSVFSHWLNYFSTPPQTIPTHPLQNLTYQEYDQKLNETFQSIQGIAQDSELTNIFAQIEQERHHDRGRDYLEWER
jgi:hypothetical protein